MRIAIDALGGDHVPAAPVAGAVQAVEAFEDVTVVLVGEPESLQAELAKHGHADHPRIAVHDAPEQVGYDDPVKSIRKSDKVSARACADLLHRGDVQGVLTMGNTGAAVAAATLYCRRLAGVKRTGIALTPWKKLLVLSVGSPATSMSGSRVSSRLAHSASVSESPLIAFQAARSAGSLASAAFSRL